MVHFGSGAFGTLPPGTHRVWSFFMNPDNASSCTFFSSSTVLADEVGAVGGIAMITFFGVRCMSPAASVSPTGTF
jgi:hypothetical protein